MPSVRMLTRSAAKSPTAAPINVQPNHVLLIPLGRMAVSVSRIQDRVGLAVALAGCGIHPAEQDAGMIDPDGSQPTFSAWRRIGSPLPLALRGVIARILRIAASGARR